MENIYEWVEVAIRDESVAVNYKLSDASIYGSITCASDLLCWHEDDIRDYACDAVGMGKMYAEEIEIIRTESND